MQHTIRATAIALAITVGSFTSLYADLADDLASDVVITRDEWGVPHVNGRTLPAMAFGMAYAQCEDNFPQVADMFRKAIGRHAEVAGEKGLANDLLMRTFELPGEAQEFLQSASDTERGMLEAFAAGLNRYVADHPQAQALPTVLEHYEPWHVIANDRFTMLDFFYGRAHAPKPRAEPIEEPLRRRGSNAWAIGPSRTKNGSAMLFVNPHQPWYGPGQLYEVHASCDDGLNFSGCCLFGSPVPHFGHNGLLGWTHTFNDPDIADVYRETFDHPDDPLKYRYDDGWKTADEWTETIRVKEGNELTDQTFAFRKTHHGPCVKQEDDSHWLAVRFAGLRENRLEQILGMARATSFDEWYAALSLQRLPMFNVVYADHAGNIFYMYNGTIPRRDPQFDWVKPVDGSDPRTEWQGIHPVEELPQVLNPPSGFVQNCNSCPFRTTDEGNPFAKDYASYMIEDRHDDRRRAMISRKLLREAEDVTFDDWQRMAFDTTLYWPLAALPQYERALPKLRASNPKLADTVEPLLRHLLDWDCVATSDCDRTPLCVEWYAIMYGDRYPAETLEDRFVADPDEKWQALVEAAGNLKKQHGDWKVKWGDIHRLQRVAPGLEIIQAGATFNSLFDSLPCPGAPGPLGVVMTVYATPPIPLIRSTRYALVGNSYMGVYEFGETPRTMSLVPLGSSADPKSPHFFDQAKLFSEKRFKPAWFSPADVAQHAVEQYHPGRRGR